MGAMDSLMANMLPNILKSMGVDAAAIEGALGKIVNTVNGYEQQFRAVAKRLDLLEQHAETNNALLKRILDILEAAEEVKIKPLELPAPIDVEKVSD